MNCHWQVDLEYILNYFWICHNITVYLCHPSIIPSVNMSDICLPICLAVSVPMPLSLSLSLSAWFKMAISLCMPVDLSVCLLRSFILPTSIGVCIYVCMSVYLSVYLSTIPSANQSMSIMSTMPFISIYQSQHPFSYLVVREWEGLIHSSRRKLISTISLVSHQPYISSPKIPKLPYLMSSSWAAAASLAVSAGLSDPPSVKTIIMFGALGRSPLSSRNTSVRVVLIPAAVSVLPRLYGILSIALSTCSGWTRKRNKNFCHCLWLL